MIKLHRLNKKEFVLNADLIRSLESTPDTLITLEGTGDKMMVLESIDEVLEKVKQFRHECFQGPLVSRSE
jgi:flagellar protein FlbD